MNNSSSYFGWHWNEAPAVPDRDSQMPASQWIAPTDIEILNGHLCFVLDADAADNAVTADAAMLDRFVRLADSSDSAILSYAARWGILDLCEHDTPRYHSMDWRMPPITSIPTCKLAVLDGDEDWRVEPLATWRRYSLQARTILEIGADLQAGILPPSDYWDTVCWDRTIRYDQERALDAQRKALMDVVTEWLRVGGVSPSLYWSNSGPQVWLQSPGLFGGLAMQLMLAICRSDGLERCSECRLPYVPSRRPRKGQRRYCPKCQADGIPRRDAERDARKRREEERKRAKR